MTRFDERQVVAAYIVALNDTGEPLSVLNRHFGSCSLVSEPGGLSVTGVKQALGWLIRNGYVKRFRYERRESNGQWVLVPREPGSPHGGNFSDTDELWRYRPTAGVRELLG